MAQLLSHNSELNLNNLQTKNYTLKKQTKVCLLFMVKQSYNPGTRIFDVDIFRVPKGHLMFLKLTLATKNISTKFNAILFITDNIQ